MKKINWWNVWAYTLSGLVLAVLIVIAFIFAMTEPIL